MGPHTEWPVKGAGVEESKGEKLLIEYMLSRVRRYFLITLHDKKRDYVNKTGKAWRYKEMGKKN